MDAFWLAYVSFSYVEIEGYVFIFQIQKGFIRRYPIDSKFSYTELLGGMETFWCRGERIKSI